MKWRQKITLARPETEEYLQTGCRFAGRCPHVMDICRQVEPKNIVTDGRIVKCYLYDNTIPETVKQGARDSITLQPVG
jgi:peptide/nickel transport system ATP-binding protein